MKMLVTRGEAARLLKCSMGVFDASIRKRIRTFMVGRTPMFLKDDVIGCYEACRFIGGDPLKVFR